MPKRITPVHELIRAAVEPPLDRALSHAQPVQKLREVEPSRAVAQHGGGEPAERVPAVRLRARLSRDPAFVRLRVRVHRSSVERELDQMLKPSGG